LDNLSKLTQKTKQYSRIRLIHSP